MDVAIGPCMQLFSRNYYPGHCNSVYGSIATSSCRELFGREDILTKRLNMKQPHFAESSNETHSVSVADEYKNQLDRQSKNSENRLKQSEIHNKERNAEKCINDTGTDVKTKSGESKSENFLISIKFSPFFSGSREIRRHRFHAD